MNSFNPSMNSIGQRPALGGYEVPSRGEDRALPGPLRVSGQSFYLFEREHSNA